MGLPQPAGDRPLSKLIETRAEFQQLAHARLEDVPMDQDPVVSEQTESGKRLIEALAAAGFDVRVAFWAKPSDDGKWFLYLASPAVDEKGPLAAYRFVFDVLRQIPDLGIEPLEVKVIGLNDSLAQAALALTKPTVT